MLNCQIITSKEDLKACYEIRTKVFIEEQNVSSEIEMDDLDSIASHFLIYSDKIPVATGRLVKTNDNMGKIGRIAVLKEYRGQNIGYFLMNKIINYAKEQNLSILPISAQSHALAFYEKFGFKAYGEEFLEANIPHYMMRLDFGD